LVGVSDDIAQNLETQFFSALDGRAARVMRKLLAVGAQLTLDDRAHWARFLLSLLYRNREGVKLIKDHMADLVRATLVALEDDWAKRRKLDETRSLTEALADRERGYAGVRAANIIADIVCNHRALPDILRMNWVVLNLRNSTIPLLTSDRPVFFGALSDPLADHRPMGRYRGKRPYHPELCPASGGRSGRGHAQCHSECFRSNGHDPRSRMGKTV
jgi:Protein of unknown function (DUF4238)